MNLNTTSTMKSRSKPDNPPSGSPEGFCFATGLVMCTRINRLCDRSLIG